MQTVEIHDSAKDDVRRIISVDRSGGLRVVALLEQMQCDADLQGRMLDRVTDDPDELIDIMRWVEQYNKGNDLYRLKIWEADHSKSLPYRVIYAYLPYDHLINFVVLGVIHRKDFNYEPDNEFTRRVLRDYRDTRV